MRRTTLGLLSGLLAAILSAPTQAGITVTSYETTALTNGFAPFSLDQYIVSRRSPTSRLQSPKSRETGPGPTQTALQIRGISSARRASRAPRRST